MGILDVTGCIIRFEVEEPPLPRTGPTGLVVSCIFVCSCVGIGASLWFLSGELFLHEVWERSGKEEALLGQLCPFQPSPHLS